MNVIRLMNRPVFNEWHRFSSMLWGVALVLGYQHEWLYAGLILLIQFPIHIGANITARQWPPPKQPSTGGDA